MLNHVELCGILWNQIEPVPSDITIAVVSANILLMYRASGP